jgi:large subunit ribosomal protein L7/L12
LKEAKELVEKTPVVIKQGVSKTESDEIMKVLTTAGATIEVL